MVAVVAAVVIRRGPCNIVTDVARKMGSGDGSIQIRQIEHAQSHRLGKLDHLRPRRYLLLDSVGVRRTRALALLFLLLDADTCSQNEQSLIRSQASVLWVGEKYT